MIQAFTGHRTPNVQPRLFHGRFTGCHQAR